jgi:hypothetical protein
MNLRNLRTKNNERWLLLILPSALIIFFWPVILGRRFFWEDIVQQFYPMLSFLANSLRSFRLPYWSPYVFSGIPFINDIQGQTFYPPNWLLTLFIRSSGRLNFWAFEIVILLHVLAAGLFMYKLAREWKLARPAAVFTGLCFMLSGFMILRTIHLGVIYTYTWFPLLMLFFHRSIYDRKLHAALTGSLVFGLAALGGYPQTLMHMGYALALYALFFIITQYRERGLETVWRSAASLVLIVLVGVGVAAVQYLPSSNYVKYTLRTSLSFQDLVDASLRPVQLVTLLAPKFFGSVAGGLPENTDTVQFWAGTMEYHYWETVVYLGILPLTFALAALWNRKQPLRWFLLVLSTVAVILALGRYTPLYRLALAILPGFSRFRIPGRLSDLFTFGTCLLAGLGADQFLRRGSERLTRRLLTAIAIVAGIAFLVWVLFVTGELRGLAPEFAQPQNYANSTRQWGLFLVMAVMAVGLLLYRNQKWFSATAGFWLIVAFTFVDLYAFGHNFNSSPTDPDKSPYVQNSEVTRLQNESRQEPFRINSRIPKVATLLGRNQGELDHLELLEGYTPLGIARYTPFVEPQPWVLDLLNAKYKTKIDSVGRRIALVPNPTYLPRARMLYRYQVAASDSEALRVVKAGVFDYRNVAILEQDPGFPCRPSDSVANQVTITRREASRMELKVTTAETGILCLSEVYYPEWQAKLNGRLVKIYPVDFVLRGITVPAGTHQIEMYYDGRRIRIGMIISLLVLLLSVVAIIILSRPMNRATDEHRTKHKDTKETPLNP